MATLCVGKTATSVKVHQLEEPADDWEEWEDDDVNTTVDADRSFQDHQSSATSQSRKGARSGKSKNHRPSSAFNMRLPKSRRGRKAEVPELDTQLTTPSTSSFRRDSLKVSHAAYLSARRGNYVDAAALKALEGDPSPASVGNWNWLRAAGAESSVLASVSPEEQELSPEDRPIMIGISLPSSTVEPQTVSAVTLTADDGHISREYELGHGRYALLGKKAQGDKARRSIWPFDSIRSSYRSSRRRSRSSIYSQATTLWHTYETKGLPPIPKPPPNIAGHRPESVESRSNGWWDHIFNSKRTSFSGQSQRWGRGAKQHQDNNNTSNNAANIVEENLDSANVALARVAAAKAPILRAPTPQSQLTALMPRAIVTRGLSGTPECPPPYSSPKNQDAKAAAGRFQAVYPHGHSLDSHFLCSPRISSPAAGAKTTPSGKPGQLPRKDPLAPLRRTGEPSLLVGNVLPVHARGPPPSQGHVYSAAGRSGREVERQRRRHEKEDALARRAGGYWRGRGCVSSKGCFGRTGREGRKRRRVWMAICAIIAIIILLLIVLLVVLLTRRHAADEAPLSSRWVNLTDFPPMPAGVSTIIGPDNTDAKSICTQPSTLWSCSLPKDQHPSVAPYKPNQPTLIMQIQWDNDTRRAWNTATKGSAPPPPPLARRRALGAASNAMALLLNRARAVAPPSTAFRPEPSAPSFEEMWFLGNTTDKIKSDMKAGEPTPFYISLLRSLNDSAPSAGTSLSRRENSPDIGNATFKNLVPPPDLEADGSSVPATLIPHPIQQPLRLYDRGLPTEHYGFYTYFKKTIFVKSLTVRDRNIDGVPLDQDGGCRKSEASHVVTWGDTRLLVQIWTRTLDANTSSLLVEGDDRRRSQDAKPGNMPYPVTITQDTHGGDPDRKLVWGRRVDDRLRVQTDSAEAIVNNMGVGGSWVNRRGSGEAKFGGFDGGTGGCRCEWRNWV